MKPLVGISLCLDEQGRWKAGRTYQYIDTAYSRAVEQAGGRVVHLPVQEDPATLVESIHGLLIPGGDDLLPDSHYPDGVRFEPTPAAQLGFDRGLLSAALAADLPILAVCYGMQLLALHHGGSLHYDIPTDLAGVDDHQLPEAEGRHPIEIARGSRLEQALGGCADPVNSRHHQAVSTPGGALVACAHSADGLIEAIEHPAGDFCIGVQWHPEKMDGPHRENLFRAFVDACADRG
ncbi:MAG: gamma-glutamyl-gamma-aminobutyrate hydrolase family protein [Deltaproteobacteria bacterium]|nr:MAG: gamma-glutamyl-gamma-aminobutyrate hydrolase family protein [Deltaproteobacteria bacterium]